MTDTADDIGKLLADARLVVNFGARSGRLTDNRLLAAIAKVEATAGEDVHKGDVVNDLIAALNQGVQAIAPVTLVDLGSGWKPFPVHPLYRIWRVLFALFAVLIIVVTAYYTQMYTQTNVILGQLSAIQARNEVDKSERLYRFFVENSAALFPPGSKDANASVFEQYLQSYEDLLALDTQVSTYMKLSCGLIAQADYVPLLTPLLQDKSSAAVGLGQRINPFCGDPSNLYRSQKNYGGPSSPAATTGPAALALDKMIQGQAGAGVTAGVTAGAAGDVGFTSLTMDQNEMDTFLVKAGIPGAVNRSLGVAFLPSVIYQCQEVVAVLGVWLLPLLYGIFGATVFQMRAILNPLLPDPSPERLILRMALGGFAGVIILLMFGFGPQKLSDGTPSVSIGAFGLAFLLGFSVDIFFVILDRLVTAVSQSLAPSGKMRA